MTKLFLTLFLIIILFKLSFAYAESQCADLFQDQNVSNLSFENRLNILFLSNIVIDRVDKAREQYFKSSGDEHYAFEYSEAFRPANELIYQGVLSDIEKVWLSVGINKTLDNLSEVPPEFVPTKQLLQENVAVIMANAKLDAAKSALSRNEGNIISLDPNKFSLNADYIAARRSVFKLIDSYAQKSMPRDIKVIRIEDLLLADVRYQSLKASERDALAERIVDTIEESESPQTESYIEKYYSRLKVRIP